MTYEQPRADLVAEATNYVGIYEIFETLEQGQDPHAAFRGLDTSYLEYIVSRLKDRIEIQKKVFGGSSDNPELEAFQLPKIGTIPHIADTAEMLRVAETELRMRKSSGIFGRTADKLRKIAT